MYRFFKTLLLLSSVHVYSAEINDACPFDLKESSGWDLVELETDVVKEEAYGIPKHSLGYRFLTEFPTGFVESSADATKLLSVVFDPFLYKLNATKPDLPPRRRCSYDDWKEKLDVTDIDGEPKESIRGEMSRGFPCKGVCGCYLRYSDACPTTGYKTVYLPVPRWWCHYNCTNDASA